jgi:hypothetical protein
MACGSSAEAAGSDEGGVEGGIDEAIEDVDVENTGGAAEEEPGVREGSIQGRGEDQSVMAEDNIPGSEDEVPPDRQ